MYRVLLVAAVLAALTSCKKDTPNGLPPSTDWKSATPGGNVDPGVGNTAPTDPSNPHAGIDMGGGPATGNMPNDSIHSGVATGSDQPNTMPEKTPPTTLDKTADGKLVLGPFALAEPAGWTAKPVTSSMRAAQFVLSEKKGEEAEMVVYYFGQSGAGPLEANIDRWLGQLTQTNGKPTKDIAKIEKAKFAGQDATIISATGHIMTSAMPGGPPPMDIADGMLLAAIVESPTGPYYFKGTGSRKTLQANMAKFKAMLSSLQLRPGANAGGGSAADTGNGW